MAHLSTPLAPSRNLRPALVSFKVSETRMFAIRWYGKSLDTGSQENIHLQTSFNHVTQHMTYKQHVFHFVNDKL